MAPEDSDRPQIPTSKNPDDDSPHEPLPSDPSAHSQSQPNANPAKTVRWSAELTQEFDPPSGTDMSPENNSSRAAPSSSKVSMEAVRGVMGKWRKKAKEAAKKTEDYAGNVLQHLRTGPSVADTAMGRIAHTTKVLTEGGYEKIFRNTFDTLPDEKLKKSFACYLSTSAGPVIGTLYLSTSKLAFCSDNPLSYQIDEKTEWSYYKVVIPLQQLKKADSSASKINRAEKYIQVVSVDNHEFWFMGFMNYDSAVKSLREASIEGHMSEIDPV